MRLVTAALAACFAGQALLGLAPGLCLDGPRVCHVFSYSVVRPGCAVLEAARPGSCCAHRDEARHADDRPEGKPALHEERVAPNQPCTDVPVAWASLKTDTDQTMPPVLPGLVPPAEAVAAMRPAAAPVPLPCSRAAPPRAPTRESLQVFLL